MSRTKQLIKNLSQVASAAGAIVSVVEFINLFRYEAGVKKELYCKKEGKLTTHVLISWDDVRSLRKKAREDNPLSQETLPDEKDIMFMSINPLAPKPHLCLSCNTMKWE